MIIYINTQAFEVDEAVTLKHALTEFGALPPYAILLNEDFLPKSEHETRLLLEGDKVEVISAIQGG